MKIRKLSRLLLILMLAACCACSSSDDDDDNGFDDSGKARVRFVNLAPDAPAVDVFIDDDVFSENIVYGINDGYHDVDAGTRAVRVSIRNTFTDLVLGVYAFEDGQDYTIFVTGRIENTEGTVYFDDNDRASDGRVKLRIVHAVDSPQSVNVYITTPGADLTTAIPSVIDLPFRERSVYLQNAPGVYQIRITLTNSIVPIADSGPLVFTEGQVLTAAVAESLGGGPPYAVPVFIDRE